MRAVQLGTMMSQHGWASQAMPCRRVPSFTFSHSHSVLSIVSHLSKDFVHILCIVESREVLLNPFGSWI